MNKLISVFAIFFITVAVLALGALEGTSQVPAAKSTAKVVRTVHHIAFPTNGTESQILPGPVPSGHVFVLTDFVATNLNAGTPVLCNIRRDSSTNLMTVAVAEEDSFSHSFGTGIIFSEGQIPQVQIDRNISGGIAITVTGYITKKV